MSNATTGLLTVTPRPMLAVPIARIRAAAMVCSMRVRAATTVRATRSTVPAFPSSAAWPAAAMGTTAPTLPIPGIRSTSSAMTATRTTATIAPSAARTHAAAMVIPSSSAVTTRNATTATTRISTRAITRARYRNVFPRLRTILTATESTMTVMAASTKTSRDNPLAVG